MDHDLEEAAIEGNIDALENLREKIRQVKADDGCTILHIVCRSYKSECMKFILREFRDLLIKVDKRGRTALHYAAEQEYPNAVDILIIEAKTLLSSEEFDKFIRYADCNGNTALHTAVYEYLDEDELEVVKLLVKADPTHEHSGNHELKTPLYIAAEKGDYEIVNVIFEYCKSPSFAGPRGQTALHIAACSDSKMVECLINAARRVLSTFFFKGFIAKADDEGNLALHQAVLRNQVEVVKLLIDPTCPIYLYVNNSSKTPLYMAAEKGYKDIFELIFECNRYQRFDGPDDKTILHAAVESGRIDCVTFILDKKGDLVLKRDNKGWTAVDYAASTNFLSVLEILVQTEKKKLPHNYSQYEQFFVKRPHKDTGLHRAAFEGHISTVIQIMKLYPDFVWSAVNKDGQNILHIAVYQSHKELVQAILKDCPYLGQILNMKDEKGNTPLHLLVMRGCFILEFIRHAGLDRNAKNNDNFTPYDLLYLDQNIIADQLKIKDAFEDSEFINQRWNIRLRKSNPELITSESPVYPSMRYTKDAKFKEARNLLIKKEIKLYRARINRQIIVTALITTVTFTVGFTMPGGYHQSGEVDEGSALLSEKTAFIVFMLADTLALLLSMSSLALYFVASMYQDAEEISKLVDASTLLNIVSVVATTLTFVMGIYLVLSHSSVLVLSVSVMSGFFFLLVILLMIKVMNDPIEKFRE